MKFDNNLTNRYYRVLYEIVKTSLIFLNYYLVIILRNLKF